MVSFRLLAACACGFFLAASTWAMDPSRSSSQAARTYEMQRSRARQLIHERAAREHRERQARIEARRRAGVSLQRPMTTVPWSPPAVTITQIGSTSRHDRVWPVR
jgi:hypothetical protein